MHRRKYKKARQKWQRLPKILKREGANATTMARFYQTIVQAVLLYGAGSWTVSKRNMDKLERFHNRAIRHMTGKHIKKEMDGTWTYPNHEELRRKCKLQPIERYVERRRGTLRRYLEEYKPELMREITRMTRPARDPNKILWWEQRWLSKRKMNRLSLE